MNYDKAKQPTNMPQRASLDYRLKVYCKVNFSTSLSPPVRALRLSPSRGLKKKQKEGADNTTQTVTFEEDFEHNFPPLNFPSGPVHSPPHAVMLSSLCSAHGEVERRETPP